MSSVTDHYDRHLGPVYNWMLGDFGEAVQGAHSDLEQVGIVTGAGGKACDLGAGTGVYSVAFADMGFSVVAIDSCAALLDELRANSASRNVTGVLGDLTSFPELCPGPLDVVVCMGDTLTHLASLASVKRLFSEVASALAPGGVFVATYRDYATSVLVGTARFIPVRSDANRILTCFLDYGPDSVLVHDILHERIDTGWKTTVSAYPKLRLDPQWARDALAATGLEVTTERGPRGMVRLVGRRATRLTPEE